VSSEPNHRPFPENKKRIFTTRFARDTEPQRSYQVKERGMKGEGFSSLSSLLGISREFLWASVSLAKRVVETSLPLAE
jgi:hypothetical protein